MLIRVQATVRCGACEELSALNALLTSSACAGCGALVDLPEESWAAVLEDVAERGGALAPAESIAVDWDGPAGAVRLQLARVKPTCPHCDEPWPRVNGPFSCPGCDEAISVREPPHGAGAVRRIIGEDRALLEGRRNTTLETLSCPGCGAPLTADGSARKLRCGACDAEAVLPDEIWRRLHAPRQVAPWFLALGGAGSEEVLGKDLLVSNLSVDAEGRLLICGIYDDTPALLCVEADPVRLVWTCNLSAELGDELPYAAPLPDGRIAVYDQDSRQIHLIEGTKGERVGGFSIARPLRDLVADHDGTLLAVTVGDLQLVRYDTTGASRPVWPRLGCLGSFMAFFTGSAFDQPGHRMQAVHYGRWARGHDGFLRLQTVLHLGRFDRDSWLTWSCMPDGELSPSLDIAPGAAADGTTFATCVQRQHDDMDGLIVRVKPDGSGSTVIARRKGEAFTGLAVLPDGRVWATTPLEIQLMDRDGKLLWRRRMA